MAKEMPKSYVVFMSIIGGILLAAAASPRKAQAKTSK